MFVAKDVCESLGIKNYRDAYAKLEDYQKGVALTDTLGGRQEMNVVNEAGVYGLAFSSRKTEAKRFTRWVTETVLPTLRKTGSYTVGLRCR